MTDSTSLLAPSRERILLWLLAFIQFTAMTDFVIMMPLAPQIMQALQITPSQFAAAVSAYAWCAGLSGFFAATYVDRFDRKRLLLTMFALFALANLGCAMAGNFHFLLLARAFAGITGGVMRSIIMAIVGDVIPAQRRGEATGVVMTAFSMATVAGVPLGVMLGAHLGWQSPFAVLAVLSALVWLAAARIVPSLTAHLARGVTPLSRALPELGRLIAKPSHLTAFVMTALVMSSGMFIIPFFSPMLVANQGISPADISWLYMLGGLATFFTARFIGRLSDRHGNHRVFRWLSLLAMLPMLAVTHLPPLPFVVILFIFPSFMIVVSGRGIPLQSLQTMVPEPAHRGAFLSVNSAVQSVATGFGAWLGGQLVSMDAAGHLVGYGVNGWVAAGLTCAAALWVGRVRPARAKLPEGAVARPA